MENRSLHLLPGDGMPQLTAGEGRVLLTSGCRKYGLNYHSVYPKLFSEIEAVDGRLVVHEETLRRLSRERGQDKPATTDNLPPAA